MKKEHAAEAAVLTEQLDELDALLEALKYGHSNRVHRVSFVVTGERKGEMSYELDTRTMTSTVSARRDVVLERLKQIGVEL